VGRKGSHAGHTPSNFSHSTLPPSTRGLGNINKSDYAYSDYSASSNPDSIDIKANSDFNSAQLQKVYQRLQRANAKILKYDEASKAQKKLVRDLQDSNTELRAQNQTLRKEKKQLEKNLKKMKQEISRGKKSEKSRGRDRRNTGHRRRNSFHDLLAKSQSAATVSHSVTGVTMMADPTGLVVDAAAPVILQNPEPFVAQPTGTLFTDASGASFYVASPDADPTQQVVQPAPMYIGHVMS
jgi:myosin heavy subunit